MKITDKTKFIYIMTSEDELEVRFMYDIAHCALYLTYNKAVAFNEQIIVSDTPKEDLAARMKFFEKYEVITSSMLYDYIKNVNCDNLILISSCHGNLYGISAKNVIKPFLLTESIKSNAHMKRCIAFFGQCYAGIFNHLELECPNKEIVYIGATEMRSGYSTLHSWKINEDITWNWSANIFVFYLAEWLNSPIDVDGDGKFTIIDLYKFICYMTNYETENMEKTEAKRFFDEKIKTVIEKVLPPEEETKDEMDKLDEEATKELDYTIPHQDCWILNSEDAVSITIE